MKTIVLTGGGTAGHVMPNIALIPELKKYFDEIIYIGTNGIEKEIVTKEKIKFVEIKATKLIRKLSLKNLFIPYKLLKSINEAKKILTQIKPGIIFSKGGYVSIPVAIAAKKLKIPVITHESDISLGLANKIISHYSNLTLTSFPSTASNKKKFVFTGSPVRKKILNGNALKLNLDCNKKTILFFGGSLGSQALNNFVYSNIETLTSYYNVLHITGKNKKNNLIKEKNYYSVEYADNIEDFLKTSDIVISRAGANSIFELFALKKLALFIPLPRAESRGDQIQNANFFKNLNMCEVLKQENLTIGNFLNKIKYLNNNKDIIIKNIKKYNLSNPNKTITQIIYDTYLNSLS